MRPCLSCGRVILRRRFCSPKCRVKGAAPVACAGCETSFIPTHRAQKYCSIKCRHDLAYQLMVERDRLRSMRTAECTWCGHEFSRRTSSQQNMKTCSTECMGALMFTVLVCKIHVPTCAWCDSPFSTRRSKAKYCSARCNAKGSYASTKDAQLAIKRERYVPKPPHDITCLTCGELVEVRGRVLRCPPCQIIYTKGLRHDYGHRRRAQMAGTLSERIDVAYINERDGWRCGICNKRVNRALTYPHPKSASLDHIVPLAQGGTHTKDNVQLAHWICNCKKSDSLNNVRPLLFG